MTPTLMDRDAHAGDAAADARADSRDIAAEAAFVRSQYGAAAQINGIAREFDEYRDKQGARVIPTVDEDGDDMDVRFQALWLREDHRDQAATIARQEQIIAAYRATIADLSRRLRGEEWAA